MLNEDDEVRRPQRLLVPPPLDRMGVAELQAYIEVLREEISRVEAEIGRKASHLTAADALFRKG